MCFGNSNSDIGTVNNIKYAASVMILGVGGRVVASIGEKMPSVWFPMSCRLTAADYLMVLKDKIVP